MTRIVTLVLSIVVVSVSAGGIVWLLQSEQRATPASKSGESLRDQPITSRETSSSESDRSVHTQSPTRKPQPNSATNIDAAPNAPIKVQKEVPDSGRAAPTFEEMLSLLDYQAILSPADRNALEEADRLDAQVVELYGQGKTRQAIRAAQKSLNIRRETLGARHADFATSLNNLAALYESIGDHANAEPLYRQAIEIDRETLGETHPAFASSLNNLAYLYNSMGKYSQAERIYRQAEEIYLRVLGEEHLEYATILNNLATTYEAMRKYEEVGPLYQRAGRIIKKLRGEMHPDYAASLNNLARIYLLTGKYIQAESLFRRAIRIQKEILGEQHLAYATSLTNLASTHTAMGKYASAESLYRKAMKIRRETQGRHHAGNAATLKGLGFLYHSTGEYALAESLYLEAMAMQEEELGRTHPVYAATVNGLAMLYYDAGRYAEAEPLYRQALEIFGQNLGDRDLLYAVSLNNLAVLYTAMRKYAEAEAFLRQGMSIEREVLGETRYAVSLQSLAVLYTAMGRYAEAQSTFRESREILRQELSENHPLYVTSQVNLAGSYLAMGEYAQAEPLCREALEIELDFARLTLRSQSEAAAIQFARQLHGAAPLLSVLRHLPDPKAEETYEAVWKSSGLVTRIIAERQRAATESSEGQAVALRLQEVAQELSALTLATVQPEQAETRRKRLNELNEEKETLERQLASLSETFRRTREVEESLPADLMTLLPTSAAVVDLVELTVYHQPVGGNGKLQTTREYDAFVLRPTTEEPGYRVEWLHLGPAEPINKAVEDWVTLINDSADPRRGTALDPASLARAAEEVKRLVWQPLESHLAGVEHVVLLPDSQLHFLPWAALPGRERGTYLLEDYVLSTGTSGQELYRQMIEPLPRDDGLLLVGGVNYDARPDSSPAPSVAPAPLELADSLPRFRSSVPLPAERPVWDYLEGTHQEAEAIASMWSRSDSASSPPALLAGSAAGEATLQNLMPSTRYIHLATHGFFADPQFRSAFQHDPAQEQLFGAPGQELLTAGGATVAGRNPLILSGVVVAGANLPPVEDELGLPTADDGILTAQEIVNLDLRGTELVTLSACDTGQGTAVGGGEGIYGLQRAFHLAGARHVVASLWKVNDQATAALMNVFYHELWEKQQPPSHALRNAQLYLLHHPDEIETLAQADFRGLDLTAPVPQSGREEPRPPQPRATASPHLAAVHLWAAFVHSGPPQPPSVAGEQ